MSKLLALAKLCAALGSGMCMHRGAMPLLGVVDLNGQPSSHVLLPVRCRHTAFLVAAANLSPPMEPHACTCDVQPNNHAYHRILRPHFSA